MDFSSSHCSNGVTYTLEGTNGRDAMFVTSIRHDGLTGSIWR